MKKIIFALASLLIFVTIQDLVDMFGFSSISHLNRYVKNQLGVNPNEMRR